jgi:hypothetical protein
MNQVIVDYIFNASAKTIQLPGVATIDIEAVRFIKNLTTDSFIYSFADSVPGITVVGNTITFTSSNAGMADTDLLVIQYDAYESIDIQKVDTINLPSVGQKTSNNSFPVVVATEQTQDKFLTGAAAQSVLNNNIFLETAGSGWIDTFLDGVTFRSFYCAIYASAGITAGQITFEATNDITKTPVIMSCFDDAVITGTTIQAAIGIAANANRYFSGKISYRYIRCRISTAFAGGTIQAVTRMSLTDYVPRVTPVGPTSGATFATTVSSSLPAGANIIGAMNFASGVAVTDIASAALTTSTTTAAITPGNVSVVEFTINVTVVSGTSPTLDVQIQISKDAGVNWIPIYDFPRITAVGSYVTPKLLLEGNRIRYVQTVGGTTPSFTRSLIRNSSAGNGAILRQQFSRSIDILTLDSATTALWTEGCNEVSLILATGNNLITTPVVITLEGSETNSDFYDLGNINVTGADPSKTYHTKVSGILAKFIRARVSTAGVDGNLNYVSVKARG